MNLFNPVHEHNQFVLYAFSDLRCYILMKLYTVNVLYREQMDFNNYQMLSEKGENTLPVSSERSLLLGETVKTGGQHWQSWDQ